MSSRWLSDSYVLSLNRAINLWHTQGQRPRCLLLSPAQKASCRLHARQYLSHDGGVLGWKCTHVLRRIGGRACLLRQRLGLRAGGAGFSTAALRRSADLSHRMSRLRNTLQTVSKAVSGTQADILTRIARLKPAKAGKESRCGQAAPAASDDGASASSGGEGKEEPKPHPPAGEPVNTTQGKPAVGSTKSAVAKQTTPLFHPGSLSASLDETYNYLAGHINAYFGGATKPDERKQDPGSDARTSSAEGDQNTENRPGLVPVSDKVTPVTTAGPPPPNQVTPAPAPTAESPRSSPKRGLGHYLTYSAPTVQAFVGSYIAPLVPRFRSDPKTSTAEKDKVAAAPEGPLEEKEAAESKDQKTTDEKAKRLLLQREKIIARVSVDNRTRGLVRALHRATDVRVYISRVEELSYHLLEFPETRVVAVKEKAIPCLLRLRQAGDPFLQAAVREALTLVGYIDPVKGRGIRVLSIDGGGTRGLVALQTLHKLEALSGKPIYQLFDYICGVSTGAILGFMLGVFQMPLRECEELYRKLGSDIFKQNVIVGTVKMGWSHAFYDSKIWEDILKEKMGSDLLVETSRNPDCPKLSAVSTVVNRGTPLKAYVFRNYNLPPGVRSHYRGGCQHQLWQAVRASSAAPGYFQEFSLGGDLHQDGGLLVNNPTAVAVHECQCLWPGTPLQCVVSLGTGRFESAGEQSATHTSLKTKLTHIISSATDTEEVHTMLDGLLPANAYFRFNPYMREDVSLDESRREKMDLLQAECQRYLDRNEEKLRKAANILTQKKAPAQRLADWAKLKADMYSGDPFSRPAP
ncbi:calcium-independent phospholipase A2-gamma-like [Denticeps clupeoides]|uniref:PNPLA domain-containing protein n=1 Tax=Denticeps clupeoides TaxID=299321 RepID=A0AAY4C422_9TELE|nr:calcium-independent phospholipase A2-gamma-like [Denticeps clupeoides]